MSKMSKAVFSMREEQVLRPDEAVKNFMGGTSYKLNPLDTLKMIAASSIFGEASYYRSNVTDGKFETHSFVDEFHEENFKRFTNKTTTEIFEESIDESLEYDFKGTLELAVELRNTYNMRLNPQIIMVRAAIHPKRKEFTEKNPSMFDKINQEVMSRADEPMSQLAYYLFLNKGNKNNIPSILKRSIGKKLSNLSAYEINKYKNHEIGMINAVRLTHANSTLVDQLMTNGNVETLGEIETWEQKRSAGMSWVEILKTTKMGHMALLRNLRNIFTEVNDDESCNEILKYLKNGVKSGKQFPFRYYNAYNVIYNSRVNFKAKILDALEDCIDIATKENMPKLTGKTVCLSDNSASAWNGFTSEYGHTVIAEIDNLSSVIAAACSDEGYVIKFGDRIKEFPISKRNGILSQAKSINNNRDHDVGGATEGGIWEFFRNAIDNKIVYDNIFIFSDQQAGIGRLYGTKEHQIIYTRNGYGIKGTWQTYVNVFKLILEYRRKVNPKVNVFSTQTAGYNNVLIPSMSYRTAMLTGWTGKEIQFAVEYKNQWDKIEQRN